MRSAAGACLAVFGVRESICFAGLAVRESTSHPACAFAFGSVGENACRMSADVLLLVVIIMT